jgi:thioester reductase-like protein
MTVARDILITGATGAVGSSAALSCLRETLDRIKLLLRADSPAHLEQRFAKLCTFWNLAPSDIESRVEIAAGDLSMPDLGLDSATYDRWAGSVTNIIHSAGNVRLNQSLEAARTDSLIPLHHVVAFAERCMENGQFQKLEHLSTVGVGGKSVRSLPERPLREAPQFHNTYEHAKFDAEQWLLSKMHAGFPATVFRPSMVVGDTQTGKIIHFQVFYFLAAFLTGQRTAGILPHLRDVRLDIIPVDYVARALALSMSHPETRGRIFHLASGTKSMTLTRLSELLREYEKSKGKRLPTLRLVPSSSIRKALPLLRPFLPRKLRRSIDTLPYFLDYLDESQQFENQETDAFFSKLGLTVSEPTSYLPVIMKYFDERRAEARP